MTIIGIILVTLLAVYIAILAFFRQFKRKVLQRRILIELYVAPRSDKSLARELHISRSVLIKELTKIKDNLLKTSQRHGVVLCQLTPDGCAVVERMVAKTLQ